ncbi:MAG: tetratricopeptide repeat protein [Nitrospirae bacterium]|nr:tetratricopeptide repeat protein [Nitrospirota bacterium]
MLNDGIALKAREAFKKGSALAEQGNHEQAIIELQNAEVLFRQIDVKGHPFTAPLANGVSGLANTLVLIGLSHQKLGNYQKAVQYFESSFINSKFEKAHHFSKFAETINENLLACYDKMLSLRLLNRTEDILESAPEINTAFQFPFSLHQDALILARLYELSPERYRSYQNFYRRAKEKDSEIRKREKKSDEASMRTLSFLIWSILIIIWAVYGTVVIDALVSQK